MPRLVNRWPFCEGVMYPEILGERGARYMPRPVNEQPLVSVVEHLAYESMAIS